VKAVMSVKPWAGPSVPRPDELEELNPSDMQRFEEETCGGLGITHRTQETLNGIPEAQSTAR